MKKIIFFIFFILEAVPYWESQDFKMAEIVPRAEPVLPQVIESLRSDWQRWSYIHELVQTAQFVASMQVSDSLDPEFGGIIEGEDQLGIVETDNTQQAIWVWTRYYEITGDTTYFLNTRRAWIYIMNHPAYLEEGTESDYYRVWNCGLALFGETKYRQTFNDTTYLWYSDSCARYIIHHPLPFDAPDPYYRRLHPKVTSLVAGMLYQYGQVMGNQTYCDSALNCGMRVKNWIEENPSVNINDEIWAMSGGTAVWGLCRSIFDADTLMGQSWLSTYLPYMKYYQPSGTWNNSWNIWYANAYNFSGRILQNGTYLNYHHSLTDSMLIQDYDDDGGIPPTRSWNQYQDHSWVSNYMVFMGFEGLMDSIKNSDAGVRYLYARGPRDFFLNGDSLHLFIIAANYGFLPITNVEISLSGVFSAETTLDFSIGEEDTIFFSQIWIPNDTGYFLFTGNCYHPLDERHANDTVSNTVYIRPLRVINGTVIDTISNCGIFAKLYFQFIDDTLNSYFDSTHTDSLTGNFTVHLIDSIYNVYAYTEIPYPDLKRESVYVTLDSISNLDFFTSPADLAIINRDNSGLYSEYYTAPLDSLGITSKVWKPIIQGLFPISRISEFNNNTIIWFTGRSVVDNVTPAEQESLIAFLTSGGNLLITGQNIGEEISQTQFYQSYLHAQLVNDSIFSWKCFPDTLDSLGQSLGKFQTTGYGGAQNQYSRDLIDTDGLAHRFLFYDSLLTDCAGIWYHDPLLNYKTIYLGFGLEAVKKAPWPGYVSRKYLLQKFLNWFGLTGIEEGNLQLAIFVRCPLQVYPNPFKNHCTIKFEILNPQSETNSNLQNPKLAPLKIYDATGRLVKSFNHLTIQSFNQVIWDGRDELGRNLPSGVYFVHLETADYRKVKKVVLLR